MVVVWKKGVSLRVFMSCTQSRGIEYNSGFAKLRCWGGFAPPRNFAKPSAVSGKRLDGFADINSTLEYQ